RRVDEGPLPDLRPEQPEKPGDERRPLQLIDQERVRQILVQGGDQFVAPHEVAPQGLFSRSELADQQPLQQDHGGGGDQPAGGIDQRDERQPERITPCVADQAHRREQDAREADESGGRENNTEELDRRALEAQFDRRIERRGIRELSVHFSLRQEETG